MRSCDTVVALGATTRHGQTLFAKNSDRPTDECQPLVLHERQTHSPGERVSCYALELPQATTTWRHIGSRPWWCWGYEHGFNEHQVVIGNEGLQSRIESSEPKLVGMEILRLGLERGRTAAEAVEAMTDAISRYGQGVFEGGPAAGRYDNGYIVADPYEAYVLETAGHHWAVKKVETTLGISNVYSVETDWDRLSPEAETFATGQGWWAEGTERFDFARAYRYRSDMLAGTGTQRRARSCAVLSREARQIDSKTMMGLLSDHSDAATPDEPFRTEVSSRGGICFHFDPEKPQQSGNTAASLVADLCGDGSRLPVYWCSFYSPCLGLFLPLFVEGNLPSFLTAGSEQTEEESAWWQFHRLAHAVAQEPEARVPLVRKPWAALQESLLESAYPVACEGRRLIDDGKTEEAECLLTEYMASNVAAMRAQLRKVLATFDISLQP